MDAPTWTAIAALGVAVSVEGTAGLIWAIRQEGRINQHDTIMQEREKRADERHEELMKRLDRFEDKLNKR